MGEKAVQQTVRVANVAAVRARVVTEGRAEAELLLLLLLLLHRRSTTSRKKKSKATTTKSTTTTTSSTKELTQREEINRRLLAGTMSTICVRTLLAPLERLKTEYLFNNSKEALFVTSKIVFKNEGVIGFWKGNLVNIVRTAPFKAINFSAFDTVRTAITKTFDVKENTVADEVSLFLSGAFACGTSW